MKILACGSRDWECRSTVRMALANATASEPPGTVTVIHGAARGADSIAEYVAFTYGFRVQAFPADWRTHGKRAGILRNLAMLDEQPDLVLAFQRNGSRGTQHTIDEARRRGIPVKVYALPLDAQTAERRPTPPVA